MHYVFLLLVLLTGCTLETSVVGTRPSYSPSYGYGSYVYPGWEQPGVWVAPGYSYRPPRRHYYKPPPRYQPPPRYYSPQRYHPQPRYQRPSYKPPQYRPPHYDPRRHHGS